MYRGIVLGIVAIENSNLQPGQYSRQATSIRQRSKRDHGLTGSCRRAVCNLRVETYTKKEEDDVFLQSTKNGMHIIKRSLFLKIGKLGAHSFLPASLIAVGNCNFKR